MHKTPTFAVPWGEMIGKQSYLQFFFGQANF